MPNTHSKINNPIKVLFISHNSSLGGAERCLIDLAFNLNKSNLIYYINIPYHGNLATHLDSLSINYITSYTDRWIPSIKNAGISHIINFIKSLRARIWSIESKIETLDIDLVYTNSITCIDGAIAAYRMKIPHIWHIHENIEGNDSLKSYLPIKLTYKIAQYFCTDFIAASKSVTKHLNKYNNINIIPNGIDINTFKTKANNYLKLELGIPTDSKLIVQVGGLIPAKGILNFIHAAEILLSKHKKNNLAFLLVGDGPSGFMKIIKNTISNSPYKNNFYLLGQRTDIPNILSDIDIFVLASESEGFSRVIVEAMAAAKPIVSTRCGGPEDIIIDGETGFLVPINDSHAISEKLLYLLEHPDAAIKMGKKGYERAQKLYSIENYVHSIEKVILETLKRHTNA